MSDDGTLTTLVPLGEVAFERPPVAEVALAIHFAEDSPRTTAQIGALWSKLLRDRYPLSQDQPLAPPQLEDFTNSTDGAPMFASLFIGSPVGSRSWFLTEDQTNLVQVQKDRIVLNWRRMEQDAYPRYPALREELVRILGLLATEGSDFNFWPLVPTQVEVTYINQVSHEFLGRPILNSVRFEWPEWFGVVGAPQLQQVFASSSIDGCPSRLYVSLGVGNAGKLQLDLTCRSQVRAGELDQALALLDDAHDRIVHGFQEVISDEMRKEWGER